MEPDVRVRLALAKIAYEALYRDGFAAFQRSDVRAAGDGAPDHLVELAMRRLADEYLIDSSDGHFFPTEIPLLVEYEEHEPTARYARNKARRAILASAADAFESNQSRLHSVRDGDRFVEGEYNEVFADCKFLEYAGLVELSVAMGAFDVEITSEGYAVARDEDRLKAALPTSASEDEEAGMQIVRQILSSMVFDLDQLVAERGWEAVGRELGRGDKQYDDGHWVDAVREYYSALESALRYRLDEAGATYGKNATLNDLARAAADANVIPVNYQAMFGFATSIRSPRSHGAGSKPEEVEIGQPEALLLGNHVRSLIVYLGNRPG